MRVIAEGCELCEPLVNPQGPCEGEHHAAVRFGSRSALMEVRADGELVRDASEAWAGSPGRLLRYEAEGPSHFCPCQASSGVFRQLIEYDSVSIRYAKQPA